MIQPLTDEARALADRFRDHLREHADNCICDQWVVHHSQVLAAEIAPSLLAAQQLLTVLDRITVGRKPQALEDAMAAARRALGGGT